jgi:WhiB family transcriptional regulator, redox-sensing transcriptional regulator
VIKGRYELSPEVVADWRDVAACSGLPHAVFFPVGDDLEDAIASAKGICAVCPVTDDCLEFALETNQKAGIWGGTSEEDRKALRRKWLATRRRVG